jgi:hypothetical protein
MLFAEGEWLVIDPGYTGKKLTSNHNTIIVNGFGMINDGTPWGEFRTYGPDKPNLQSYGKDHVSEFIRVESKKEYDYVIGDASHVYDRDARLKKYLRHIIYLKPDIYLIIDEVEADTISNFKWLLHAEDAIARVNKQQFIVTKNDAVLQIHCLMPGDVSANIYRQMVPEAREVEEMITLELSPPERMIKTHFMTLLHYGHKNHIKWITVDKIENRPSTYRLKAESHDRVISFRFQRDKDDEPIFTLEGAMQ